MFRARRPLLPITLSVSLFLLRAIPSFGGANKWSTNGPFGGPISSISVDPANPSTVYVGTQGVFKSVDAGVTWRAAGLGKSLIQILQIDPSNPQTLYAGSSGDGLFKTIDGGRSWTSSGSGLPSPYVQALLIDPRHPTTLYAGIALGMTGPSLFKTVDNGSSWSPIASGLPGDPTSALAIDPTNSQILYATVGNQVFRTIDGGEHWDSGLNGFSTGNYPLAVAVDVDDAATVYASSTLGIYRSRDRGQTWQRTPSPARIATMILSIPGVLYAVDGQSLLKSMDHADTWTSLNEGLPNPALSRTIAADPLVSSTLYLGASRGIFKSTDSGGRWLLSSTGIEAVLAFAIQVERGSSSTIWAATSVGAFLSEDAGRSWLERSTGLFFVPALSGIVSAPSDPAVLYAASTFGAVYGSIDRGMTWRRLTLQAGPVVALAVDPSVSSTVYAVVWLRGGVQKSTDAGETWQSMNVGLPVDQVLFSATSILVDPSKGSTLYLGASGFGVFKSRNGGGAWNSVSTGLTSTDIGFLAFDPSDSKTLYAGTRDQLFVSKNGAQLWKRIGNPPARTSFTALVVDPQQSQTIYVAAVGDGVFRSPDGGRSWNPFSDGLTDTEVLALAVSSNGKVVYAGTTAGAFDYRFEPTSFYTLTPCRLADTRGALGANGGPAIDAGSQRVFSIAGQCGVPATARAVALNVTATRSTAAGYLTLSEGGILDPGTLSLAYRADQTRANNAIIGLDPLGRLTVKCTQASGSVDLILDVNGYFQ